MQWEAQGHGAGIVCDDERARACAKQVRGARGGGEAGLLRGAPGLAFVAADGAPELAVFGAQQHVNGSGGHLGDGGLAALTFGIRDLAKAPPGGAAIARFHDAAGLSAAQMQRHEQLAGGQRDAIGASGVVWLVDLHQLGPSLRRITAAAEVDVDLRIEAGEEQECLFPGDEQRGIEVGPARDVLQDGRLAPGVALIR